MTAATGKHRSWHRARAVRVIPIALSCALCACAAQIPVASDVPPPLVQALPLRVGVLYDDDFKHYSYSERLIDGPEWTVELGAANVSMFDNLLPSIFAQTVPIDSMPAIGLDLDAIVKPSVDEYAFLTPRDAGVDFYSVSIRYLIELYTPEGELLGSWPINSYGRTRSRAMQGKDSLSEATELALRDAAAALSMDFKNREPIVALLPEG